MQNNNVGNEFKAVAQDVMQLGARCVQAGREWLTERRNEMTNRNEEHRQGQGPANQPRSGQANPYQEPYGAGRGTYEPRHQTGEYQPSQWERQSSRSQHHDTGGGSYSQGSLGFGYQGREAGEGYGTSSGYGSPDQDSYNDTANYRAQDFATPGDTQPRYGGDVRRQSYAGRGPRNYTRSDERITEDLCERLTQDHDVDASDIDVRVSGGTAMLEGTVPQRWMKHRAEDLADGCSGVRTVENRLRVQSEASRSSGAGSLGAETTGSASRGRSGGSETGSPTTPTSSAASSGTTSSSGKSSGNTPH